MHDVKAYTPQQELFLEYLFNDPDCNSSTLKACVAAGYDRTNHRTLVTRLQDEILHRANSALAMAAPTAVRKLIDSMDEDGSIPKGDIRLKAIESVLDRAGLAKKQQVEVTSISAMPLFILPAKREVIIEHEDTEDGNA